MITIDRLRRIDPYVRMVRLKKSSGLTGKWRDIDHVFTYIASGSADFIIDGISYTVRAGEAIIIPPYQTHVILSHGNDALVQYIFHFDFFETPEREKLVHHDVLNDFDHPSLPIAEQLLENQVLIADFSENEPERVFLQRNYIAMRNEFLSSRPGREEILKEECKLLLMMTVRSRISGNAIHSVTDSIRSKAWVHVEKAINYISAPGTTPGVENQEIADVIGVSPNYLTKVFHECIGVTLHHYVILVQMEKAQKLLLSGQYNVTEVASRAGFSSVYAFSKAFKKQFGISPSEFIENTVNIEQEAFSITG